MSMATFGQMPDGTNVREVTIAAGDLSATVISYGAVLRDLRLRGVGHPLVLGFDNLEDYIGHSPDFGAVVGRSANCIAGGRLTIDGEAHQLSTNGGGKHHIDGGFTGFSRRTWRILDSDASSVALAIIGADSEEGYPGNVEVICRYRIEPPSTLRVEARAATDSPTVVNLAHRSYFNLDDSRDVLSHDLQMFAEFYAPTDAEGIPNGDILAVAGTDFDFRYPREIRFMRDGKRVPYDVNFAVSRERAATPRPHARLASRKNGVTLTISSTDPGIRFSDGAGIGTIPVAGIGGRRYGPSAGCCLAPQGFPDAPNQSRFPSTILRTGEAYRQASQYTFSRESPRSAGDGAG